MQKINIKLSPNFIKKYKKLINKRVFLREKVEVCLEKLQIDVFYPSLHTYKAQTVHGNLFSSRVTGDIRIIWRYKKEKIEIIKIIEIIDIGGHSGKNKVYK